jgi:DNA-binding transcriptional regulator YdaS (Cro superfamily)
MTTEPLEIRVPKTDDGRIGRMVEVALDLLGIQKQELAARMDMSPQYLGQKIAGARPWKSTEIKRIATATGFNVGFFYADPAQVMEDLIQSTNYRKAS